MAAGLERIQRALIVALLALVPASSAAGEGQDPVALEIFDAVLAKFAADREALQSWQYHQTLTTHQLDSRNKVIARGTWHSIVRPGDPNPIEYTSEQVDGKLSFFKAAAEKPRASAPPSTAGKTTPRVESEEKDEVDSALEAVQKYHLRARYLWTQSGIENAGGESAFVLTFTPKPKQNTRTREERFFAQLAGRLWVSRRDHSVLKAEAELQAPANLFWVLARVITFRLTYHLQSGTGAGRLFRHSQASAETVVAFPLSTVRQRHWLTVDKFEPRTR